MEAIRGSDAALIALTMALLAALLAAVGGAGRRRNESRGTAVRWMGWTLVGAAGWLAVTGGVAGAGLLRDYDALPPPMFRIVLPGVALAALLAFSRFGARLTEGLGWGALIGFQAFRIPVELLLDALRQEGRLPVQMTFHGANFDILSGLSALAVAWLASRGRIGLRAILAWNVASLLLLANIVGIAILSMPGRLRLFQGEPANTLVFGWPFVWLPAWLVLAALFGHLLVFRKAWRMWRAAA